MEVTPEDPEDLTRRRLPRWRRRYSLDKLSHRLPTKWRCCSRGSAWRSFHCPIIPSPASGRDSGDTHTPAGKDPLTGNGKQGYRRPWNGAILRHRALEHTCRGSNVVGRAANVNLWKKMETDCP